MRVRAFFALAALLLFADAGAAHAATYYVATSGSDSNPGTTQGAPFASLQKAHDVAVAGDTIYVRGGTYMLTTYVNLTRSGSSANRIKLFNFPGETPILDGTNIPTYYHPDIDLTGSGWHIKGLEVRNAPMLGIHVRNGSSDNIFELCVFHHNVRMAGSGAGLGLETTAGGRNLILNNDLHHNSVNQSSGTGGDGIGISTRAAGNVIRGNRVWRNHDDGIDLSWSYGVLLEGNWAWENGIDDNLQKTSGNGCGFKLGLNNPQEGNHIVRNNLVWRNGEDGFNDNGAGTPTTAYNNTGWANNRSGTFNFNFWSPVANVVRNNLSLDPETVSLNGSVVHDHNSWNGGVTASLADVVSTDFTANLGPRKSDGSLPDSDFLRLAPGSDLIDKGVNVGLPFSGAAPDVGAYEFGATAACQATTLNAASLTSDGGFGWMTPDRASFGTPADTSAASTLSTLRLFEGATELGPAHAAHADVRNLGLGRFSHWSTDGTTQSIRFSTTDNSNPTTNGRTYSYTTGCTPFATKLAAPTNLRIVSP